MGLFIEKISLLPNVRAEISLWVQLRRRKQLRALPNAILAL
jgi:hypothetical protein